MKLHHSKTINPITMKNLHAYVYFCGEGFCDVLFIADPPGGATAYQLHRSINRQVTNMVAKNDIKLALSPTFRYDSIESPL
ncbi:uncharacterized protein TNCV_2963001 [Trichonephila clavipes]|nr:uncharacterized protein TNCV_2963001 [Trichonephila clavipes]